MLTFCSNYQDIQCILKEHNIIIKWTAVIIHKKYSNPQIENTIE